MALTKEEFIEEIKSMSVLDLAEIVKAIEDEFGVSAAPVAVAAVGGGAAPVVEEEIKDEFDVNLKEVGADKIRVIKAVRELTPLGLKEAKDLVENAPSVILKSIGQEPADQAKTKLEAAGAVVELT